MAKLFTVKNVIRTVRLKRDGTFEDVYEITFETASGIISSVQVPVEGYSPEIASAVITEEAKKLEETMRL